MRKDSTWLKQCSWTNEERLQGSIRAVVLQFHGLGGGYRPPGGYSLFELECAAHGALVVHPYYGPWSWMNRAARTFVDDIVDTVYAEFGLAASLPLLSTGGSMGGCSALLYCRYGKRKPAAALALYPVCDTQLHYDERPDLPASFNHAFLGYPETLETCLREHSPLEQTPLMPDIPYLVIHGDSDQAVNKEMHSDRFVAAMRALGRNVRYMEIPGMGHGGNMPLAVHLESFRFVENHLTQGE